MMFFMTQLVNIFQKFIEEFIAWLRNSEGIPTVIQNLGLALLTILIPLAIAVLEDTNRRRKDKRKLLGDLDLHVVLDYVFQIPRLLLWVAFIFLPFLLWDILVSLPTLRILPILLSGIGIYFIGQTILKGYLWVKGRVWDFRFSYLNSFRDYKDVENVWRSVWQARVINREDIDLPSPNEEQKFFEVFVSQIENLLKNCEGILFNFKKVKEKNRLKLISKLLNDFLRFINNRSVFFLSYHGLQKILEWHFRIWKKNYEYLRDKNKIEEWGNYNEILRILDSILFKIEERALQERMAFCFFDHLKNHIEKYKEEKVDNEYYYVDYLLSLNSLCKKLFEDIPSSPEHNIIWSHYFPKQWKITKANLEKKFRISWGMLNCFLEWSRDKICEDLEKYDPTLDEILRELFPEVDPITFADILVFAICPWSGKRTEFFIKRKRNFGLAGRIRTFGFNFDPFDKESRKKKERESFERVRKLEEEERKKAIELGYYLFKNQFTSQKLEEYVKELEKLKGKYEEDSMEEDKRKRLTEIFKEMNKLVEKK